MVGNPVGDWAEKARDRGVGQETRSLQSVFLQVRLQETGIVEVRKKSTIHQQPSLAMELPSFRDDFPPEHEDFRVAGLLECRMHDIPWALHVTIS